ncbi:MAG: hypothetical protein JOZ19_02450 [Rubrobacter sp.]|nr:hypothetical protein [Rubrobacter sp.]
MQFRWYCSLAVVLVAAYVLLPARLPVWRNLALVLLVLTVFADLFVADRDAMAEQDLTWWGWTVKTRDTDFASYYSPSAARFLQSREGEEPFRYLGYDSGLTEGSHLSSPAWFADSETHMLEANGRPMLTGLQSVHGYNPTHISHYDQFMSTLNKGEQNYHFMDVYEKGLASPLLDLLNARYIIVPTDPSQENPDGVGRFERFGSTHPTVYEDNDSKVLENQ